MKIQTFSLLVFLEGACLAICMESTGSSVSKTELQKPINGGHEELVRHKRGWGSVLFYSTSLLIKTTGMGLSLSTALTGGCTYYQSICNDNKQIERLDKEIKDLSATYEQEYAETRQTYQKLKTATTNNEYNQFYINHIIQTMESLGDIENTLATIMHTHLPRLSSNDAVTKNIKFNKYIRDVLVQSEYRLRDIRKMMLDNKDSAIVGFALEYVIQATANKLIKSFTSSQDTSGEGNVLPNINDLWGKMDPKQEHQKLTILKNIILVPKLVVQIAKSFGGQGFKVVGSDLNKWKPSQSWKEFKGRFTQPTARLNKVRAFFSPNVNKHFVKNFKLSWSAKIMTGIGILGDVITQIVSAKKWHDVSVKMAEVRKKYEEYLKSLQNELETLLSEKQKMNNFWPETVGIFKDINFLFKSLLANASNNIMFSNVVESAQIPLETNNPFFSIAFDQLTWLTIDSAQNELLQYLRKNDVQLTVIEDKMKSRHILHKFSLDESENGETISDILSNIQSIFRFSPPMTMKSYGSQLQLKDMVCTVSILRMDLTEYDYYPLEQFRPKCDVSQSNFQNLKLLAATERKGELMKSVVVKEIKDKREESLSRVLDAVHNAYFGVVDLDIRQFGSTVTEHEIICTISKEFSTKLIYDFINLELFRPDCSAVSNNKLQEMLGTAAKLRTLANSLRSFLEICKSHKNCPCFSTIANHHQLTENDVLAIVKQIDPEWRQNEAAVYCGSTGCSCNHL